MNNYLCTHVTTSSVQLYSVIGLCTCMDRIYRIFSEDSWLVFLDIRVLLVICALRGCNISEARRHLRPLDTAGMWSNPGDWE